MENQFRQLLEENKAAIIEKWREVILTTYSPDTAKFLRSEADPFANPVGAAINKTLEPIFDHLAQTQTRGDVDQMIDDLLRIRAVQAFAPSQAVGFLSHLKAVVREAIGTNSLEAQELRSLLEFESRIDQLVLLGFETYMKCREQLYKIQATEIRSRSMRILTELNERFGRPSAETEASDAPTPIRDGKRGGSK